MFQGVEYGQVEYLKCLFWYRSSAFCCKTKCCARRHCASCFLVGCEVSVLRDGKSFEAHPESDPFGVCLEIREYDHAQYV
jgi:hypothetical protein